MAPARTLPGLLRREWLVLATMLAVVLLAVVNWALSPEQAQRWLRAMLVLPALYLGITLWTVWLRRSTPPTGDEGQARQRYVHQALTMMALAGGVPQIAWLGPEIWVRFGDHRADMEFERRMLGLVAGAVFIGVGNALPKILTPLSILPLPLAERVTRARRFVGTSWFVLGLAMAAAFLALPLDVAGPFAGWAGVIGVTTVLGAIVWMNLGPARRGER